jgi:hypothetical protein
MFKRSCVLACALASCVESSSSLAGNELALDSVAPLHGVHHRDAPQGPALVDAVGSWSGRAFEVAAAYAPSTTWAALHDLGWQLPAWSRWTHEVPGRRFVYSLPMLVGPDATLAACARGEYDVHFAAVGRALVDADLHDAIVRIGWEFDGDWFPWSARDHEGEYAGCFQSAVRAMRSVGGTFSFEWSASDDVFMRPLDALIASYPGDAYVDIFGVNAYDVSWAANTYPLPADCDASCASQHRTAAWDDLMQGVFFMRDLAASRGKPISIPEWGLWERSDGHGGGDNADYIARMHAFVNDPQNRVFYQAYFDIDWGDGAHQISNVGDSVDQTHTTRFPAAAAKYRELFGAD